MSVRVGIGYDVHAFAPPDAARVLVIGGVAIPHERGLSGHSDADVLLHAVVDALLGAAALGDIGAHFPSSDGRWQGAPSTVFLTATRDLLGERGWAVANVDTTIVAERPRLGPHVAAMRAHIAQALADELALAEGPHAVDQRDECLALFGERVLNLGRHLGIHPAAQHALGLQRAQPLGERLGADAVQRALELAEALGAGDQIADDQQRPLAADDLRRALHGTDIHQVGCGGLPGRVRRCCLGVHRRHIPFCRAIATRGPHQMPSIPRRIRLLIE